MVGSSSAEAIWDASSALEGGRGLIGIGADEAAAGW